MRLAWVLLCALAVTVAAVGRDKPVRIPPPVAGPVPPPGFQPGFAGDGNYKAPKADGAVIELLDEGIEPLFPVLVNDGGGEAGTVAREDRDVFAGVEAARVTPMQKYRSHIPGWAFKIVEKPEKAGEFRFLRFAWKKLGGTGIVVQFHDPAKSWAFRYHAGNNVFGWQPSTQVNPKLPGEWEVVTRDLFKDWGEITLTGFALSPLDGTAGLFDHMMLGRSVADLDKATDTALGRTKPEKALAGAERDAHWDALLGTERAKATAAIRAFLAAAPDQVAYIGEKLGKIAVDKDALARVNKLLKELDADSFEVRDRATDELVKMGAIAQEAVKELADNAPNPEVGYRAKLVLRRMTGGAAPVGTAGRLARVVRVLERADTEDARALLDKMAQGEYGFEVAPDARAARARLKK
ncbi:MAG: hypothetical protein FJ304_06880 [Planctomycetes bacterium]|nr:hypothetical protein [Planctomycetota bacterium]